MHEVRQAFYQMCRKLNKLSHDRPSDTLKRKVAELEKKRKRRHPNKDDLYVDVPESRAWLDTATMPMILTAVGTALFAKILMMLDEANAQERLEKKIKNAPEGQGTVRMLTREEWEKMREVRPRTPFESTIARPNAKIRTGEPLRALVSWEEGGYTTSDKPMPRGEVVIGGASVSAGYFNNEAKTVEVYKVDEKGMRWFYTGDVGRFHPDGCLEIIDRKKDIVKLQHGEYISLGKVEAALSSSNYVENIMVYADPFHTFCVALVVPARQVLEGWANESGIKFNDFSELCEKEEAKKEVQQSLAKAGKAAKLDKFELPAKIALLPEPWTPESGLVTAALKLKREQLKAKFKNELEKLYK